MAAPTTSTMSATSAATDASAVVGEAEVVSVEELAQRGRAPQTGGGPPAPFFRRVLERMPTEKRRSGRLLVSFFCLMVVFTLVSRGLDSFTVATVSATTVRPGGTISRSLTVYGTVEPLSEYAVAVPEGFLIKQALVEEGSRVEEGDVLALLDMDSIQTQLADARRALERAQLNAAKAAGSGSEAAEYDPYADAGLKLERAEEDLETTRRVEEEAVAQARADLAEARFERNGMYGGDYDEAAVDAIEEKIKNLERAYETAVQAAERNILAAERAVEDAELAVEKVFRDEEEEARLKAESDRSSSLDNRINQLSVEEAQEKIARLQRLVEHEGQILAEQGGVVLETSLKTGGVTGSGGAVVLGDTASGVLFRGTAEEEVGKYLARGDAVEVSLPGLSQTVSAAIETIAPPKEKGGDYTVTLLLEEVEADPGASGSFTAEKKGDHTGMALPLSAVYSENNSTVSGYVFVLREKNTTMGTQTVAEKISVEMLERNTTHVLVEGPLTGDDLIITGSSRPVSAGDRVREEESE